MASRSVRALPRFGGRGMPVMLYFHSSPSPASVKNAATPGQIRALGHDGAMLLNYLSGAD